MMQQRRNDNQTSMMPSSPSPSSNNNNNKGEKGGGGMPTVALGLFLVLNIALSMERWIATAGMGGASIITASVTDEKYIKVSCETEEKQPEQQQQSAGAAGAPPLPQPAVAAPPAPAPAKRTKRPPKKTATTSVTTPAAAETTPGKIPRKLHFVYLSPGYPDEQDPIPEHYAFNMQGWKELHPDWTVTLWNNKMMKEEFPNIPALLPNVTAMAWVSDLLRYHVIQKYGGVYLDMDIAPVRNMDYLIENYGPTFSDCEDHGGKRQALPPTSVEKYKVLNQPYSRDHDKGLLLCRNINNNVIASVPNQEVLKCVIDGGIEDSVKDLKASNDGNPKYRLARTGPKRWTQCIWENPIVNIMHSGLFHPCGFFDREECDVEQYKQEGMHVYGMHEWKGSWKNHGKGMTATQSEVAQNGRSLTGTTTATTAATTAAASSTAATTSNTNPVEIPERLAAPAPAPAKRGRKIPQTTTTSVATTAKTKPGQIPKRLHFVYLSPGYPDSQDPIPDHYAYNMKGWADLHPGWTVTLWNNKMMKKEFPNIPALLPNVTAMAWVSDLLRYHVIQKYGGVYLDMDIAPVRNMDYLIENYGPTFSDCEDHATSRQLPPPTSVENYKVPNMPFVKSREGKKLKLCRTINNNVIASVPNADVLKCVIDEGIEDSIKDLKASSDGNPKYRLARTGPKRWTPCIFKHPSVNILHSGLFHPCGFFDREECNVEKYKQEEHVYGMHEWKGSWKNNGKGMSATESEKQNG